MDVQVERLDEGNLGGRVVGLAPDAGLVVGGVYPEVELARHRVVARPRRGRCHLQKKKKLRISP